jgi:CHAD domain-containing protein
MTSSAGSGAQLEIESKFDVSAEFAIPSLGGIDAVAAVGDPVELDLDATYFDTADLRLAHAGVALRRRSGGTDDGWHLKLAQALDERIEVRRPLGRDATHVPAALHDLVLARVRDRPLVPIATLRTHRVVHHVLGPGGTPVAEIADDRVTGESGSAVTAWREVEVELVDGDRELLASVGARLQEAGAEPSDASSKLARLLDIRPDGDGAPTAGPDSTAGEVLLAHLTEQATALASLDPLVRVDSPDAVHKMRVAVRRLRSALATYRRLLDRSITDPLRDELRWLGRVLGPVRDAEVTRENLRHEIADQPRSLVIGPVARRIDRTLGAEHRDAHRRALTELRSDRYLRLLDDVDAVAGGSALKGKRANRAARKQLPREVRRAFDRMAGFVEQAAAAASPDEADRLLHEVRKAAKRVRYAAESVQPAIGSDATDLAKAMEQLQDVLGEHNDSVVVRPLLRRLGVEAEEAGDSAFTFGRLHALEEWRAARTRQQCDDMIEGLAKPPKWLR